METCITCGGALRSERVTAENWWGDQLALVEDVPALVCERCGEQYLDAETISALDMLRVKPAPAARTMSVPIYRYAER